MPKRKRIGILTSGGDCGGLNAVTRAVVRRARDYDMEVFGIKDATAGLMARPVEAELLDVKRVSGILRYGGTILGTVNKGNPFAFPMPDGSLADRSAEVIEGYHRLGLDALIGVGGDGSLAILRKLALQGNWNFVGVPKTIDNDVGATEYSVGFNTALSVAVEALDQLTYTAISHSRVMVMEVMGRDAGHIAISAGIAGGAHVILIPEIPYTLEKVCRKIIDRKERGNNFSIVVVAEAVKTESGEPVTYTNSLGQCLYGGIGQYIGNEIALRTGIETRVMILGHLQRGGTPSPLDRLLGAAFGVAAVDLIARGQFDHMVAWQNRRVVAVPLVEAIAQYRGVEVDGVLVATAMGLNTYVGELDPIFFPTLGPS
ncbi:ATP-dependent 6-phosphofructokinase [Synechococcus sp. Nb3U1]|uniref:ATP-dependent 6-phosphofructokinase n=1 Tax=Synechococcus sp. Nb3U1 TaxID=1914529 RepID=UPI001F1658CA|nr:ATP-dependent 6-phosphofructokinase [Synechococcus sp. Nb3U1]MCF2970666.1 ATP-dependent 6-phosphofructokinase [Synechococcus sp. Nb3U1]